MPWGQERSLLPMDLGLESNWLALATDENSQHMGIGGGV